MPCAGVEVLFVKAAASSVARAWSTTQVPGQKPESDAPPDEGVDAQGAFARMYDNLPAPTAQQLKKALVAGGFEVFRTLPEEVVLGELADAVEERVVLVGREIGALCTEHHADADLAVVSVGSDAHAGVEDQVLPHALGEDNFVPERPEDLKARGDEGLFELLRGDGGHERWFEWNESRR